MKVRMYGIIKFDYVFIINIHFTYLNNITECMENKIKVPHMPNLLPGSAM